MTMTYIGYIICKACGDTTYINKPAQIKIWAHQDDDSVIAEAKCSKCKTVFECRITWEHASNFRKRGCKILSLSDKFSPLTEKDIVEFEENFDAEYCRLLEAI